MSEEKTPAKVLPKDEHNAIHNQIRDYIRTNLKIQITTDYVSDPSGELLVIELFDGKDSIYSDRISKRALQSKDSF